MKEEEKKKKERQSHMQTQLEKATYNTASRRDGEGSGGEGVD